MASNGKSNRATPTRLSTVRVTVPSIAGAGATIARDLASAVSAGVRVFNGSGVPGSLGQVSGDIYVRSDTLSTTNQRIYIYNGSSWAAAL